MSTIDALLAGFKVISLPEADSVKLMNRIDTKMVFDLESLPCILKAMIPYYRILEVVGVVSQEYDSIYYDTRVNRCYLDHHNKRLNRVKIRRRTYCATGQEFLEVKKKDNKGRTKKVRRELTPEMVGSRLENDPWLVRHAGIGSDDLVAVLTVHFTRMTFVNFDQTERLTIDTGLTFQQEGHMQALPHVVIAEIKQNRLNASAFRKITEANHIHPYRVSKYCLGRAMLDHHLKQNNFKEKIHHINKIEHDVH